MPVWRWPWWPIPLTNIFFSLSLSRTRVSIAPTDRAIQVGNVVQSPSNTISVGPFKDIAVPDFLAKAFNKADSIFDEKLDIDHLAMDEECYLGKDGDLEECADFDP